jgi:hypothetical protein
MRNEEHVCLGMLALLNEGRRIWGDDDFDRLNLDEIVVRLMVGVGDLARAARDGGLAHAGSSTDDARRRGEIQKELGNLILSTVRWIDDLGLDPIKCLDLAVEAQKAFAKSERPR